MRLILNTVHGSRCQLCDFSAAELLKISAEVRNVTATASGTNVSEVNQSASDLVAKDLARNGRVKRAIDAALPAGCQLE